MRILRPRGAYESRDRETITGLDGTPLAEAHLAPSMLVSLILGELRAASTQGEEERLDAIVRAGQLFAESNLDGEDPEEYCRKTALLTGLPIGVMKRSLGEMAAYTAAIGRSIWEQSPLGAANWESDLSVVTQSSIWMPRGKVLSVIAPSNHPMTHVSWLQALAFGYHVAVRPGRRDPFTPKRLFNALLQAGLSPGHLAFLPGPHSIVDPLIQGADLAIVYGNQQMEDLYAGHKNVLVRGPGRSKMFVDKDMPLEAVLDTLVEAAAKDGGVRCTNASAILTDGDAKRLAEALAARLAALSAVVNTDEMSILPRYSHAEAASIRAAFDEKRGGVEDLCKRYHEDTVIDLGDGSALLRPAVVCCDVNHPAFGLELSFPCVWVAACDVEQNLEPIRSSLALTLITQKKELVSRALRDASIRKVFWGRVSTCHSSPELPHDGYLGSFLLEAKGYAREKEETYELGR